MHCIHVQLSYIIIYTHVVHMDEGGFLCIVYIHTIPLCTILYPIKSCSIPLPDDNIMLPKQIIHMML